MNEIKRMQQLAGLNEIKVNKPLTKKDIFDYFYPNHFGLLISMDNYRDEIIKSIKDGSLKEYLENDWGYEDSLGEISKNVINFYKLFKNTDIDARYIQRHDEFKSTDNNLYQNLIVDEYDGDYYIIRYNL